MADAAGVGDSAAAGAQVCFIGVERGRPGGRAPAAGLPARHRPAALDRLPEVEHVLAIGVLVIVGGADLGVPIVALAVGDPEVPSAGAFGAPVADPDAGRGQRIAVRSALARQDQAGAAAIDPRRRGPCGPSGRRVRFMSCMHG
jgi:hypothetical protein